MKRLSWKPGLALVVLAAAAFAMGQERADTGRQVGDASAEARVLVKQLEAQVEGQRAQLEATQASLTRARNLLSTLEHGISSERLHVLREREHELVAQLETINRVSADPRDPMIKHLTRQLEKVRDEVKRLEGVSPR